MNKNQEKRPSKTEYHRTQSLRLPTPPPDPQAISKPSVPDKQTVEESSENCKVTDKENNELIDYLNSLPNVPNKAQQTDNKSSLQRSGSIFTPIIATENAFDHLDKLYKLMEQLLNLREQNAKLQRKVRDLEHLHNLQNLDNLVTNRVLQGDEPEVPDLDADSIIAEALLDDMFNKTSKKYKPSTQFKFRQSILRPQRDRSTSVAVDGSVDPVKVTTVSTATSIPRNSSGKSLPERGILRKPSKVSKWTRVKAAFKWEKASLSVAGAKSQDSGIGGMMPVNNEVARYLRVPSTCDNPNEAGTSPADSVLSGSWNAVHGLSTPGTLSPASSTDDLNASANSDPRSVSRTDSAGNTTTSTRQFRASKTSDEEEGDRRSRSLDLTGNCSCDNSSIITKEDLLKLQASKSHKTPWGKVKDIIQTRKDSLKKKQHRLSTKSDDFRNMDYSAGSDQEDVFEATNNDNPIVTITNSEEGTKEKSESNIPEDVVARYQKVAAEEDRYQTKSNNESPRVQRKISKWTKVKKAFLTSASTSRNDDDSKSMPSSPTNKHCHFFTDIPMQSWKSFDEEKYQPDRNDIETRKLKEEIHKNYEQLQKKLSQEFQEKLLEWERVKTNANYGGNSSNVSQGGGTSNANNDDQRDPEFIRKMEEWEKIKNQNADINKKRNIAMTCEENLPPDFKKKLQEWQKIKKFGGKDEDTNMSKSMKKKNDWQLWRSNSSPKHDNSLAACHPETRQYSEDFLKKLDEWKQIKASNFSNDNIHDHRKSIKDNKSPSPNLGRKASGNKLIRQNKNHKMQEWLEKELQKIEREKQRLEREREKFLEREERLAKLRRSIGNNTHKKDVLVQTSTGFFRFEGISRKFTQRLYEWEKARGIGPEASTFALLHSGFHQIHPAVDTSNRSVPYKREQMPRIKLTRSKSMDSVANLTCGEPLISHQPSSLSLNDVEELEIQCLTESQSERNLNESEDNLDYGEPEAVIVEVEDFVEETAAPLEEIAQENHCTPVYETQTMKLCESEKCEAPEIRRSESAKALSNYNLIQESLVILNKIKNTEETCKETELKINEISVDCNEQEKVKYTGAIPKRPKNLQSQRITSYQNHLNTFYVKQKELSESLIRKIILLQNANTEVTKNVTNDNCGYTISKLSDTLIITQDLSMELVSLTEKLKSILFERYDQFHSSQNQFRISKKCKEDIINMIDLLIVKIKELKRCLTYLCAASDMTAPGRRKGSYKDRKIKRSSLEHLSTVNDKVNIINDSSDEEDQTNKKIKYPRRRDRLVKSKSEDNQIINYAKIQVTSLNDQGKERTERYYQLNRSSKSQAHLNFQSLDNTSSEIITNKFDNCSELSRKNKCQRKLMRSRRISDSEPNKNINEIPEPDKKESKIEHNKSNLNIIVPTNIQYLDATLNNEIENIPSSPVSVFVHTTRRVFTPFTSEIFNKKNEKTNLMDVPKENDNKILENKNKIDLQKSLSLECSLISKDNLVLKEDNKISKKYEEQNVNETFETQNSRPTTPCHLPPLPSSPIVQRRDRHLSKETSPAIRMMIARYNQKLFEQDTPGNKSAGSSGSASPIAWRSPVLERRVKAQTEKYQEEVNKTLMNSNSYSPLFMKKQVQKSASVGVISPVKKQLTSPQISQRGSSLDSSETNASPKLIRGILKSTSVGSMKTNIVSESFNKPEVLTEEPNENRIQKSSSNLKLSIPPSKIEEFQKLSPNSQERAHKLQKAKEEFLSQKLDSPSTSAGPFTTSSISERQEENPLKYPTRNRLSQVSFGSESSFDDMNTSGLLVKSASAGMINVDEATYEQFRPEIHSQGYVSLPRASKKKDGKFGISSLASKFRKVKMRRSKDPTQMNTVSTLCRQSLVVDISETEMADKTINKKNYPHTSNSDINAPSTSKTSWIKNPTKIFKPK